MESLPTAKRPAPPDDGPSPKKLNPLSEVPAQYSDAVRKKLALTSRTAQACDRCKERKMKCDTDPVVCQPCRQKNLRCFTTDRLTGEARERGQFDRAESEINFLRNQLLAYQTKYGTLQPEDVPLGASRRPSQLQGAPIPSAHYIGWPTADNTEPLNRGPVYGTMVDILDGVIDVCDFPCELMESPPESQYDVFNLSRTSIINTIFGFQRMPDPVLPAKEETLRDVEHFLIVMSQYIPIVHRPSIRDQVHRLFDRPETVSLPERIQVLIIVGIIAYQSALRNYVTSAENLEKSHRYIHCALGYYRYIYHDISLPAMQALALLVIHFRSMPKPGVTWSFCHQVLVRLIELQYHRDPEKITLPPNERTLLAKELRKRVFHSVLGVCISTSYRVGLPVPWQFSQVDLPLPKALKDEELSADGMLPKRSGSCEFHPCLHISRILPLLTDLYNNVISVRRSGSEYLQTVEALDAKIVAWRQHWDECIKHEKMEPTLQVAGLLIETWFAEYQLMLHHPVCCTAESPEAMEKNLDICHKAAKRLLQAFHTLSKQFKGVDFTWHSTAVYAMGFGVTLYIYRRRKGAVTREQYQNISNELNGWMSLMAYADVVLKTNNHLQHIFQPRSQALDEEYRKLMIEPPTPPPVPQSSFAPVNGSAPNSRVKVETTSQPPLKAANAAPPLEAVAPPSPAMHNHNSSSPPIYAGPQGSSFPANSWAPAGPHLAPIQYPPASTTPQDYPPYQQATALSTPTSQPPQFQQQIPASLPPLLNHPTDVFVSYPAQPQTSTHTAAPLTDFSQMTFNQLHYYGDGTDSYAWPLITMPPGTQ